jgi:hypothetical protein
MTSSAVPGPDLREPMGSFVLLNQSSRMFSMSVPKFELHSGCPEDERTNMVGVYENIDEARKQAKILAAKHSGRYFVVSTASRKVVFSVYHSRQV